MGWSQDTQSMSIKPFMVLPLILITIGISQLKDEHRAQLHKAAGAKSTITRAVKASPQPVATAAPATIAPAPTPEPTPVPTPAPTPRPAAPVYSTGGVEQWRSLVSSYFPGEESYALAIMKCESGGRSDATGYNTNGSTDRGLFQINSVHSAKVGGDLSALYDPATNMRVAAQIRSGSGWGAWSCSRKI